MHKAGLLGQLSHYGGNTFAYQNRAQSARENKPFPPALPCFLAFPPGDVLFSFCQFCSPLSLSLGGSRSAQQRSVSPSEEILYS